MASLFYPEIQSNSQTDNENTVLSRGYSLTKGCQTGVKRSNCQPGQGIPLGWEFWRTRLVGKRTIERVRIRALYSINPRSTLSPAPLAPGAQTMLTSPTPIKPKKPPLEADPPSTRPLPPC